MPYSSVNLHLGLSVGDVLATTSEIGSNNYWYCVIGVNGVGAGSAYNLYLGGVRPAGVIAAPGMGTILWEGVPHVVFTTSALQTWGIGYLVRWRAMGASISDVGQWVTPPANWSNSVGWMPPPSAGLPFWRSVIMYWDGFSMPSYTCATRHSALSSLQDWWTLVNSRSDKNYCLGIFAQTEVRYVLIKPAVQVVDQLNARSGSVSIGSTLVKNSPNGAQPETTRGRFDHTLTISAKPWGTCTTPSVTVDFNQIHAPGVGSPGAWKPFDLSLTKCPRVSLQYYFHANNKWVNKAQGIVGMSGSSVHLNPVVGNPRGIGIQLAHNGDTVHGNSIVQISPNSGDPGKVLYSRTYAQRTSNDPAGATHTIKLRARVVRTHPDNTTSIQSGLFNTSLIMVISYP